MAALPEIHPDSFLPAVLDHVGVALAVIDAQGRFIFTNQAALEMFGWTEGQSRLSVQRLRRNYVFRDSQGRPIPAEQSPIMRALAGEQVPPQETEVTLPDGQRKWLHAAGHRFSIFGMTGVLVVVNDETEEVRWRRAWERSQNADALGLLMGGMAHDLNNMISIISASIALIGAEEGVPENVRARVEQVNVALQMGSALAARIIRHRSGQQLHPHPVQINDLVHVSLELVEPLLKDGVRVKAELGSLPEVDVDPTRIEQVLINLILNALDAMPKGGELTLRTETVERAPVAESELDDTSGKRATSFVCVTVGDTGVGIPEELQNRIFEPFFTTKSVGKGSGLGLASAYAVVRQHRGYIEFRSVPDAGTRFTIYFPAAEHAPTSHKKLAA